MKSLCLKFKTFLVVYLSLSSQIAYLWAIQADYPIDISCAVIEVGHSNSMLAGGNPVLLCVRVNLEDMSSSAVDGLLPEG